MTGLCNGKQTNQFFHIKIIPEITSYNNTRASLEQIVRTFGHLCNAERIGLNVSGKCKKNRYW